MAQMYLDTMVTARIGESCSDQSVYGIYFDDFTTYLDLFLVIVCTGYLCLVILDIRYALRFYFGLKAAHRAARNRYLYRDFFPAGHSSANNLNGDNADDPSSSSTSFQQSERPPPTPISALYDWDEIPLGVKRSFHCYWSAFTFIGLICTLVEAWQSLLVNEDRYLNLSTTGKALLGASNIIMWSTALQFMVIWPSAYAIALTMQTALPRVLLFLAGFLPMFLGFVVLGVVLFSKKMGMFKSFAQGGWGLFSFMNGDSVKPIILLMMTRSYWSGLLFSVIFLLILAYLMINILIAIIEEAYFIARRRDRTLESMMWKNLEQYAVESLKEEDSNVPVPAEGEEVNALRNSILEQSEASENIEEDDEHGDDWIKDMFSRDHPPVDPLMFTTDPLLISLAEETAEVYILGRSHFEYSKMMDYLVEHLS
eukprot:scaffold261_cov169-Ochromonas_danica.AAC.10